MWLTAHCPTPKHGKPYYLLTYLTDTRTAVLVGEGNPGDADADETAKSAFTNFQRLSPFFSSSMHVEVELGLRKVNTQHGGKNNCLLYAFLVAKDGIASAG